MDFSALDFKKVTDFARKGLDKARQYAEGLNELEIKVEEATNSDRWGPHGTLMQGMSVLTPVRRVQFAPASHNYTVKTTPVYPSFTKMYSLKRQRLQDARFHKCFSGRCRDHQALIQYGRVQADSWHSCPTPAQ